MFEEKEIKDRDRILGGRGRKPTFVSPLRS